MGRIGTGLSIWGIDKLHPAPGTEKDLDASGGGGWVKLLNMDLKVDSALVSSAISDDGLWLAVADAYETKLFKLAATVCNPQIFPSPHAKSHARIQKKGTDPSILGSSLSV